MNLIVIGKLVNTHALKGEVRIISDFQFKSRVFVPNFKLYIGKDKEEVTIKSYRHHKNFEMCLFHEYNYINDVYNALIVRDIRQKYNIQNIGLMNSLTEFMMDNISNLTSYRNIANQLNENNINTNLIC